jgi:CRISPR-associated protein Cmr5
MTPEIVPSKPTLDQRRAPHAWQAVEEVKQFDPKRAKEYGGHAQKLPTRIMAAGLGQALAFILAKAADPNSREHKPHVQKVHDHLTDWVIKERKLGAAKPDSLLHSIIAGDSDFLRRATDEALAYLLWLNRFAEAEGLTEGEEP